MILKQLNSLDGYEGGMTVKKFRIYDDRTNETLFESEDKWEATMFLADNYDEEHKDFPHVWLEEITA